MAKYLDAGGLQHYQEAIRPMLVRSCTQEQYDALSEEEKRGLFVITDANSGGGPNETVYEWWSPEMTSDTTPSPFVASASNLLQTNRLQPYKAFDNIINVVDDYYHSTNEL